MSSDVNQLISNVFDIPLTKSEYLVQCSFSNSSFLNKESKDYYLRQIDKKSIIKAVQKDINYFNYHPIIKGFRSNILNAPYGLIKEAIYDLKILPPFIFGEVLKHYYNNFILKNNDLAKKVAQIINKEIPKNFLQFDKESNYSIEELNAIDLDIEFSELVIIFSLFGVILFQNETEIIKNNNENFSGHEDVSLSVDDYLSNSEKYSNLLEDIKSRIINFVESYSNILRKIQINKEAFEIRDLIKINKNFSDFLDTYKQFKSNLSVKDDHSFFISNTDAIKLTLEILFEKEISKYLDNINSLDLFRDKLLKDEVSEEILLNTRNCLIDLISFTKNKVNELKTSIEHCFNRRKDILTIINDLSKYLNNSEVDNIIEKILGVRDFVEKNIINDLKYPKQFNLFKEQLEEKYLLMKNINKEVIIEEKNKMLIKFQEIKTGDSNFNKILNSINSIGEETSFDLLSKIRSDADQFINNWHQNDGSYLNLNKYYRDDEVTLKLLAINKIIRDKDNDGTKFVKIILQQIENIQISNSGQILLLLSIVNKLSQRIDYRLEKLSTERSKIILLMSRLYCISREDQILEFIQTFRNLIPYNENVSFKKLLDIILQNNSYSIRNIQDGQENTIGISAYFEKENSVYNHSLLKKTNYHRISKIFQLNILSVLDTKYYQKILQNKSSITKLESIKKQLNKLNAQDLFNEGEFEIKYKNLAEYESQIINHDFIKIKKDLLGFTDHLIESRKNNLDENIFYSDEFTEETKLALDILKKPIFNDLIFEYSSNESMNIIIDDLMGSRRTYLDNTDLIKLAYFNSNIDLNSILENFKVVKENDTRDIDEFKKMVIEDKVFTKISIDLAKTFLLDFDEDYFQTKKVLKSYENKILEDYRDEFNNAIKSERFGLAKKIVEESDSTQKKITSEQDNQYNIQDEKLNKRLNKIKPLIRAYSNDPYKFKKLFDTCNKIEEVLLKKDYSKYDYADNISKDLEIMLKEGHVDFNLLTEEIEIYDSLIEEHNNDKYSLAEMDRFLKNPEAIPNDALKKRISMLLENISFKELFSIIKSIREIKIYPSSKRPSDQTSLIYSLFKNFSKYFRLYSDPDNEENCKILDKNYPFFITNFYKKSIIGDREIILTILNDRKSDLSKLYIEEISEILKLSLGKKYRFDKYYIICFALYGNAKDIYDINSTSDFDCLSIISKNSFPDLILTNLEARTALHQLFIKNLSLKSINPFDTSEVVSSSKGVFIGRKDILKKITKDTKSYAIYGARRIGKSSLCKEIENKLGEQGAIVIYKSVSSSSHLDENFAEGLSLANIIIEAFTGTQSNLTSFESFTNSFSHYLNKNSETRHCIILDEFDQFIIETDEYNKKLKKTNRHFFIKALRDIKHENENFQIIISGYMHLYEVIKTEDSKIQKFENPWKGFIETQQLPILKRTEAEELLKVLEEELALQFEDDTLIPYICDNISTHPALLQKFCKNLIYKISDRVDHINRKIIKTDIDEVLNEYIENYTDGSGEQSFAEYVDQTIKLNIDEIAMAIIVTMAIDGDDEFDKSRLQKEMEWCDLDLDEKLFKNRIDTLLVNDVLMEKYNKLSFTNPFWRSYLKRNYLDNTSEFEHIIEKAKKIIGK